MARSQKAIFLARRTYRRRRMMDIGRLMPFLGVFLFMLPILWAGAARTAPGLLYLFAVWAVLIIALACLAGPIRRAEADPEATAPDRVDDEEI